MSSDTTGTVECECGCGHNTQKNNRFIRGHNSRGKNNHFYKGVDKWVEEQQALHPLCKCGCGEEIIIKPRQRQYGFPKYIQGHCPRSEETRRKLSQSNKGKTISEETRQKLILSHTGKPGYWTGKKHPMPDSRKGCNHHMYGKKQSEETILKRIKRGDEHYNWQGGTTPLTRRRTKGILWKQIADKVRIRDNNTCQLCEKDGFDKKLPIHHIIPFKTSKSNEYCNLITLCQSCHVKAEKDQDRYEALFMQKLKERGLLAE